MTEAQIWWKILRVLHRKYEIWSNIVLSIEFIVRVEHSILRTSCHMQCVHNI